MSFSAIFCHSLPFRLGPKSWKAICWLWSFITHPSCCCVVVAAAAAAAVAAGP